MFISNPYTQQLFRSFSNASNGDASLFNQPQRREAVGLHGVVKPAPPYNKVHLVERDKESLKKRFGFDKNATTWVPDPDPEMEDPGLQPGFFVVMAHAEHREAGGLGGLRTDHSGVNQVADVTADTRMLDGDLDYLAAYLCCALGRPRVIRKMNRRQRIVGKTAEIVLKELAALLDRIH